MAAMAFVSRKDFLMNLCYIAVVAFYVIVVANQVDYALDF